MAALLSVVAEQQRLVYRGERMRRREKNNNFLVPGTG
uniref:Uncharacterized protein n=1 Tax=Arundo donax TaxID=35708 RepID=A0A0A9FMY0_ARUDO